MCGDNKQIWKAVNLKTNCVNIYRNEIFLSILWIDRNRESYNNRGENE